MLVYGDHRELAEPEQRVRAVHRRIDAAAKMPPGLERHANMMAALVDAGQLLQGVADANFEHVGRDRRTAAANELGEFLLELGDAVCRSWDSRFQSVGPLPRLNVRDDWPDHVALRVPEGFAFYSVFPEAYAEAARRLALSGPPRVIGIRSIGTALGAIAAAALGAPPPVTVRPFGDPFARKIAVDPALEAELLAGDAHYVIVDEGPGQSGSSFGAVADWLQERGVPPQRIALLPSHGGPPGPAATEERRRWWGRVQRQVGDFGDRWPGLVENWCDTLLGPLDGPAQEISGGAWRRLRYANERDWPAVVPSLERRKFLVSAQGERFLVKFAGLGRIGEDKLAVARALHSEGLVPEPLGLIHGFIVERWCEGAASLTHSDKPLRDVARYIGIRAKLFPASSGSGVGVEQLLAMTGRNAAFEFGDAFAGALDAWGARMGELERRIVRVRTDNKLDRHEWLRAKSGALVKTDALDHHQGHDLVGCQDVAWDVAGALIEFDVNQSEGEALIATVESEAGRAVDRELLDLYRFSYVAFRLGQTRLGATSTADPLERRRIGRLGDRYAAHLRHLLESDCCGTRLESSVG